MKKHFALAILILALATTAFAGSNKLTLLTSTNVAGTTVAAGEYDAKWDNDGAFKLSKGRKVLVETRANAVPASKVTHTTVRKTTASDGSQVVKSIQFGGSKTELVFDQSTSASSVGK
jgi:hypothetical protein